MSEAYVVGHSNTLKYSADDLLKNGQINAKGSKNCEITDLIEKHKDLEAILKTTVLIDKMDYKELKRFKLWIDEYMSQKYQQVELFIGTAQT